jgi:hypothetical protein
MTGRAAARAAVLSARIHREVNAGRLSVAIGLSKIVDMIEGPEQWADETLLLRGYDGTDSPLSHDSFVRLGAELRAIIVGNREGAR